MLLEYDSITQLGVTYYHILHCAVIAAVHDVAAASIGVHS
jgi:hypothetical protein